MTGKRAADAALIFAFASYFASYFLRQIVNPIVIMIPTVLTYVFFQKYILAGIAAGAVKE